MQQELKDALRKDLTGQFGQLGRDVIGQWLWEVLEANFFDHVDLAENGNEHYDELLSYAALYLTGAIKSRESNDREHLERGPVMPKPHATDDRFYEFVRPAERARQRAMELAIALDMADFLPVRQFREHYLDGRVLTSDQAVRLLQSQAASLMSGDEFRNLGVPITDHFSVCTDGNWRGETRTTSILIQCATGEKRFLCDRRKIETQLYVHQIATRNDRDEIYPVIGSVLSNLRRTALQTEAVYSLNLEIGATSDIIWFILTNCPPNFSAYFAYAFSRRLGDRDQPYVHIDVPLWISTETLSQMFACFRREKISGRLKQPGVRRMNIFTWVASLELREGSLPSWKILAMRWNSEFPSEHVDDWRGFRRDYMAAKKFLLTSEGTALNRDYARTLEHSLAWYEP